MHGASLLVVIPCLVGAFLQIMQKLTTLPFQACQHRVSSLDAQPSLSGGILVFVTGQLLPEGETNPLKFSQTFHLVPVGGSFVVSNGKDSSGMAHDDPIIHAHIYVRTCLQIS